MIARTKSRLVRQAKTNHINSLEDPKKSVKMILLTKSFILHKKALYGCMAKNTPKPEQLLKKHSKVHPKIMLLNNLKTLQLYGKLLPWFDKTIRIFGPEF